MKRSEAQAGQPSTNTPKTVVESPQPSANPLSNTERNELRKLEKDIANAEASKRSIMEKFNSANLDAAEATKLSTELGALQKLIESKEVRWMELAEKAS